MILARDRLSAGDLDASTQYYAWAIPRIGGGRLAPQVLEAAGSLVLLHNFRLNHGEAARISKWWLAKARELGMPVARHHFFWSMALGNAGRVGEAMATATESLRQCERDGDHSMACRLYNLLGWLHAELGDLETATRLNRESVRRAAESGIAEAEANARINLAENLLKMREPAGAAEELEAARGLLSRDSWFRWRFEIRLETAVARCRLACSEWSRAREHAHRSLELAAPSQSRKHIASARGLLAETAAREGSSLKPRKSIERLSES